MRRNWSCPKCVDEYWNELDQRRSDAAASAATDTPFDALKLGVVELKAEVVQLKAEVEWLKAAFVELKCADTKQTTDARLGRAGLQQKAELQKPAHRNQSSPPQTLSLIHI